MLGIVVVCVGVVQFVVFFLCFGVVNVFDFVGWCFMNYNVIVVIVIDLIFWNDFVYQKIFGINDWYLLDGNGGKLFGNVQFLGWVILDILKIQVFKLFGFVVGWILCYVFDFYFILEDFLDLESRVVFKDGWI